MWGRSASASKAAASAARTLRRGKDVPGLIIPLAPGELGHEGWGRMDALGPGRSQFKIGDRVAMLSYRAYAEYDIAPERTWYRPAGSSTQMPFPGEPLGCAMNVFRRADISRGKQWRSSALVSWERADLSHAQCGRASHRHLPPALRIGIGPGLRRGRNHSPWRSTSHQWIGRRLTTGWVANGSSKPSDSNGRWIWPAELTRERGRLIIAGYHQDGPRQVNMQLWNWRGLDVINAHERDPKFIVEGMRSRDGGRGRRQNWIRTPLYTHTFQLEQISGCVEFDAGAAG